MPASASPSQTTAIAAPRALGPASALPVLLDRAATALASAKNAAEVLEAKELAGATYDAAKRQSRLLRAKEAHDTVLADVYRVQADALLIEARAKMLLADEYDAAQDRGEVAKLGSNQTQVGVPAGNTLPTASDLGLTRKDIHEARQIRDAERADPGITQRTVNEIVERGEEPTKAKVAREVVNKPKPAAPKIMDGTALWLWGRLKDFERDGVLSIDPAFLLSEMTQPMRDDVKRLAPLVSDFLAQVEAAA